MSRTRLSVALAAVGCSVFAVVAYDATLLSDAFGVPEESGEAAVAMKGRVLAVTFVASGLRGLWPARVRIANA